MPNYYGILPASVRYDKRISDFAKVFYSEMSALANRDGFCSAKDKYFMEIYGYSESKIARTVSELETCGHIRREYDGKTRKIFPLTDKLPTVKSDTNSQTSPLATVKSDCSSINTTSINNIDTAETSSAGKISKKKEDTSNDPMNLKMFIEDLRKSPQRKLHIIADFAEEKKCDFTTKGQWRQFITRNLRAAKALEPYTDNQLGGAMARLKKDLDQKYFKWTLETLSKYLD